MLEDESDSCDLDLDVESIVQTLQSPEGAPKKVAQLVLARQPHHIRKSHRVERPLGGSVERQVGSARRLAGFNRHLADREGIGLCFEFHFFRKVTGGEAIFQVALLVPTGRSVWQRVAAGEKTRMKAARPSDGHHPEHAMVGVLSDYTAEA